MRKVIRVTAPAVLILSIPAIFWWLEQPLSASDSKAKSHTVHSQTLESRPKATLELSEQQHNTDKQWANLPPEAPAEAEERYALLSDNPDYPTLSMRLEEMQARRNGRSFSKTAVLQALEQPYAWESDPEAGANLPLTYEQKNSGRSFVRFSPMRLEVLVPGDRMLLPVPPEKTEYEMLVTQVDVESDGSVTWTGELVGLLSEHEVTLSRGNNLTVGGISTPTAFYAFQAHGHEGWMASSNTLSTQAPGVPDAIVPPIDTKEEKGESHESKPDA